MVPGSHPFAELEAALLRSTLDAPDSLDAQLQDGTVGLLRAALRLLPDETSRLLLVIDQFEELFLVVRDEEVRRRFLANIVTAIDDAHGRLTFVLTLRADCYHHPLDHAEFGSRMGSSIVNVVALAPDEFEIAAEAPAARRGATLEPALMAELLTDVIGEPGALPIFQYALTELFDNRDGDVLTVAAYRAMGGVRGALSRRADDLYEGLSADQRAASRQLFLRLVTIDEHDDWGRRRVPAAELVSMDVDTVTLEAVISAVRAASIPGVRPRPDHGRTDGRGRPRGAPPGVGAAQRLDRDRPPRRQAQRFAAGGDRRMGAIESGRRLPAHREPPCRVRPLEPGDVDAPDDAGAGLPRHLARTA